MGDNDLAAVLKDIRPVSGDPDPAFAAWVLQCIRDRHENAIDDPPEPAGLVRYDLNELLGD